MRKRKSDGNMPWPVQFPSLAIWRSLDCLLYGILLMAILSVTVTGDCIYRGQRIRNDTVWAPDDCSICVCPPHPLRQEVKCTPVGECSSTDYQWLDHDMQADQRPYRFLPSNGNNPTIFQQAKESGIEVKEGEKVTLQVSDFVLKGADLQRLIRFNITEPLGPGDGKLERTDRPGQQIKEFTINDLRNKIIIYEAPTEKELNVDFGTGKEAQFTFQVIDGLTHQPRGDTWPEQKFYIRATPINVLGPRFFYRNVTIRVQKGSTIPIPPDYFQVTDPDTSPADLRIKMIREGRHGRLVNLVADSPVPVELNIEQLYEKVITGIYRYDHDGHNLEPDHIELQANDGKLTAGHVGLLDIFVEIIPVDVDAPICVGTSNMILPEGETKTVDKTIIFCHDDNSTAEHVCFRIVSVPEQGTLFKGDPNESIKRKLEPGHEFCQTDVDLNHITYTAPKEIGRIPVQFYLVFDAFDGRNNKRPNQTVTITVTPINNEPPIVKVVDVLNVTEHERGIILPDYIHISDVDSPIGDLIMEIDAPPNFGHLENKKNPNQPITSIPVTDFSTGHLVYVSKPKPGEEPRKDFFHFHVTDGPNNSDRATFHINILNHPDPFSVKTQPVTVLQGKSEIVTNSSLHVVDPDSPPHELIFTLSGDPAHGRVWIIRHPGQKPTDGKLLVPPDKFSYQDVLNGLLAYVHDDSQTTEDNIDLSATDGTHEQGVTVPVIILPPDNEGPRIVVNIGLELAKGATGTIDSTVLRATDPDSVIEQLKFTIKEDVDHGRLLLTNPATGEVVELHAGSPHNSFIQDDLNHGRLQYAHQLGDPTGQVGFTFDLSDPEGNIFPNTKFQIVIIEDPIRPPPILVNNTGITLNELDHHPITNMELAAIAYSSPSELLHFYITGGPEHGRLERVDRPGVLVTEFLQGDLDKGLILYNHTRPDNYLDFFTFKVTDGITEIANRFPIKILAKKEDTAPTAIYTSLQVNQGDRGTIGQDKLRGEDSDTEPAQLIFDVVYPPQHGHLILRREDGAEVATRSFTMDDLVNNRLIYQHDDGPAIADSFSFILTDGVHPFFFVQQPNGVRRGPLQDPEKFPITIIPRDNSVPTYTIRDIPYLAWPDDQPYPIGPITPAEIKAVDVDTKPPNLRWYVVVPPTYGHVELTTNPGVPIIEFTQDDIDNFRLRYVLTNPHAPVTSDFFILRLEDDAQPPNVINDIRVNVHWSWISYEEPEYTVQENAGVVRIVIKKVGNLNHHSIVESATQPGTATDAPGGDFQSATDQIQFQEGQDRKTFTVTIRDDQEYEGPEEFYAHLGRPVFAMLREPKRARIVITDDEDRGSVQFERPVYYTDEGVGTLPVAIIRTGDLESSVSVACVTRPMSARDFQDFIPLGPENGVTFRPGEDRATCHVQIVADRHPEGQEEFELILEQPEGSQLGVISRARVIIQDQVVDPPPPQLPSIRFTQIHCLVREASGRYLFEVIREGPDLSQPSSVICSTEAMSPGSATPNEDYVHMSDRINFAPGQRRGVCSVQIIDDSYYEGNESFYLVLSQPTGAVIGQPGRSTVTIFDTDSEVPTIQFERVDYTVEEPAGRIDLTIVRTGNVDVESTVRCFTMSRSAQPGSDYVDRPDSDHSIVVFRRGERRQTCSVTIIDDSVYESDEQFYVLLGSPHSAKLGPQGRACVTITNREDVPKISFNPVKYDVDEPRQAGTMSTVMLSIVRTGDTSRQSEVRVTTRDGNAIGQRDYHSKSQVVAFRPGETEKRFAVEILYDNEREPTETFTVWLDQPVNADVGPNAVATVCIHDQTPEPTPQLPVPPIVVSITYVPDPRGPVAPPSAGYPVMCLTPCDRRHPQHQMTKICQDATTYRWEMAVDADRDGNRVYSCISDNTPFTTASSQVLDNIYFQPNCVLRCVADTGAGQPMVSADVTVSREGVCANPRTPETKGHQRTLTTDIQYNEPSAPKYPNTVHIQVTIPHRDGIMPIISTFPIHNMKLLLNDQTYRSQHVCSNLITNRDPRIRGFLDASGAGKGYPSRSPLMDPAVRGNNTVQLYRHLDMDSCQWTFDANYDMTTLVDVCGGTVNPNARTGEFGLRSVTVTIPLYVTYVYAIPANNWGQIDHRTTLEVSFSYDTALWHDQVRTTNDNVDAKINVVRVRLADNGSLIITIKTQTKFRGTFVLAHPRARGQESRLVAPGHIPVRFSLTLDWQQETYDYPMQTWLATSDMTIGDFTGDYTLELIPCMATKPDYYSAGGGASGDLNCEPRQAKQFILPISFQQANRPVPLKYSLNTNFQLSHRDQFGGGAVADTPVTSAPLLQDDTFGKGELIHGCVMWNPVQDLKDAYKLEIQRLYVCSGKNGYKPFYDPLPVARQEPQYGCMQSNDKNLQHQYLLLDRSDPSHVTRKVRNVDFQADFVDRNVKLRNMKKRSGIDGFRFKTDPLYALGPGQQWYLQVFYVITSADQTTRYRRSVMMPAGSSSSSKYTNGTNIRDIRLRAADFASFSDASVNGQVFSLTTIVGASVAVLVLLVAVAMVTACVIIRKRRRSGGYRQPPYQMAAGRGNGPTARVRTAPRGYQLTRGGTEV